MRLSGAEFQRGFLPGLKCKSFFPEVFPLSDTGFQKIQSQSFQTSGQYPRVAFFSVVFLTTGVFTRRGFSKNFSNFSVSSRYLNSVKSRLCESAIKSSAWIFEGNSFARALSTDSSSPLLNPFSFRSIN